jgi:hypothetical protein
MTELILIAVIALVLAREVWRAWKTLPGWIKRNVQLVSGDEEERRSVDPDDVTSIANIATKLQAVLCTTSEKLESNLSDEQSRAAMLVLIQLVTQLKKQGAEERDDRYAGAGEPSDPAIALDG